MRTHEPCVHAVLGCGDCHGDRFVLLEALIVMWITMLDGANCRDVRFVRPPLGGGDCRASVRGVYSKIILNFLLNYLVNCGECCIFALVRIQDARRLCGGIYGGCCPCSLIACGGRL